MIRCSSKNMFRSRQMHRRTLKVRTKRPEKNLAVGAAPDDVHGVNPYDRTCKAPGEKPADALNHPDLS